MSKLVLTSIMAAAALGLAACGDRDQENMAVENVEDLNATEDMNMGMDMNTDMNMDMNMTDNSMDNAAGNAVDNSATTNSY
ncbi:circumsporozoite protein [Sphingomonas sp. NSE70-1]|uniref:Circumsporozoite protein n=1 Tax=Sphingomonas caseinilyticus TaxID=2908205 RepID=A0ABT0RX30_9SPHN|nr:circumsporozoite protein [Sphingomonas caseinilyticus]MCL6699376.1 circumsporozoite protein [Sphingomonas caseinilyticus]